MQYAGFDVLELEPDSAGGRGKDNASQEQNVVRSPVGLVQTTYREDAPRLEREFQWPCVGAAEVATLRAFLDARQGRLVPFWFPSWEKDIEFNSYPGASTSWSVKWFGYTANMFPGTGARRHVFARHPVTGFHYQKITGAVDNGDGTETLTLAAAIGMNIATDLTTVGFLRLCRLAEDVTRIEWHGQTLAVANIKFVEIPNEAPQ